ncbi:serine protease [Oceanicola sp. 502str15]|uniref:trypsin-like serine peptidase n=1 Tax=Oceanicola sp. 502str15 TaxID=2696061 RepID=UPI0020962CEA|nr:trypsin-like peptidase domain-containing protein [Oceanicola sp. 502str15]MCO6385136.1 trypsin-like serine protease [Oceanicola sp. 502str15]
MIRRALLAALALATATPALADSALRRLSLRSEGLGWEAVGRLDLGGGSFCSGALIETDLVLTAAHCLFDHAGNRANPRAIIFRAGYRDGMEVATRTGLRAVVMPGYVPGSDDVIGQLMADVALLQLDRPIAAANAEPYGISANVRAGENVAVASYGQGREEALSLQRSCSVLGERLGALAFSCDVTFGSSGAPVFDLTGGRPEIVSIISKGAREEGKVLSLGMRVEPAVRQLRADLRAGRGVFPQVVGAAKRVAVGASSSTGARFVRPGSGPRFVKP